MRKWTMSLLAAVLLAGVFWTGFVLPKPAHAVVKSVRELPDGTLEITFSCRRIVGNLYVLKHSRLPCSSHGLLIA
ncbi:MAG: hypothetical protein KatS3mg119_0623 [Rhodothalassiaceae bacterium]|nr:MAG: hypothetical protein KatS3mg119_0623 [Rhodothalassiaceae bacterium]